MKKVILAIVLSLGFSLNVHAAGSPKPLECYGTVSGVYITSDGFVVPSFSWAAGSGVLVCNMNTTWKGITPSTCAVYYSTAMAAYKGKNGTNLVFGGGTYPGCASVPRNSGNVAASYMLSIYNP